LGFFGAGWFGFCFFGAAGEFFRRHARVFPEGITVGRAGVFYKCDGEEMEEKKEEGFTTEARMRSTECAEKKDP
jgi:hypothetical protein